MSCCDSSGERPDKAHERGTCSTSISPHPARFASHPLPQGARVAAVAVLIVAMVGLAGAAEPVRLTQDGRLKRDPRFVGGGAEVVYSVVESPILMRLVRLNLSTLTAAPLYPQAATSQFEPSFSTDGRYQVFVEFRGVTNVK